MSTPNTRGRTGAPAGNTNANGSHRARNDDSEPIWLRRARAEFSADDWIRTKRNWRPDPVSGFPGVYGRTIRVDQETPDQRLPIRVDLPGRPPRWVATAVEARNVVEADFRDAENAARAKRLAAIRPTTTPAELHALAALLRDERPTR